MYATVIFTGLGECLTLSPESNEPPYLESLVQTGLESNIFLRENLLLNGDLAHRDYMPSDDFEKNSFKQIFFVTFQF